MLLDHEIFIYDTDGFTTDSVSFEPFTAALAIRDDFSL